MLGFLSTAAPSKLAQFEIVRRLGAGGMAEVFLAKKPGAEGTYKLLVLKRILQQQASRRLRSMFVEEAQLATRLNHPNVVQVFDFFDGGEEGQLLSMEYVEGPDLGMLMSSAKAKSTRIPPWVGAWIIAEAAKGLHYAHEKKDDAGVPLEIVHRDVSPQNILLSYEGSVKIADFGIATAKLFTDEQGVIKGKFGYMSPEQARGEKVDRRSDVYALGVILWEILTGRPLHGGLGGEALLDIVRSGFVEPPTTYAREIPPELEQIVLKALEVRKEDRFATARELGNAIARALMAKQELVDASQLEAAIGQLVVRSPAARGPAAEEEPHADEEHAAPEGPAVDTSDKPARSETDGDEEAQPGAAEPRRAAPAREVRHVAVVTLRLHGIGRLKEQDATLATRTMERLRTMLGDIAYKRNVRVWIWSNDEEAQAVAGLTANPTRAAADAAWLALDTHEAIAGLNEDLPLPIGASIGIVRGIAAGTRDKQGNLIRFRLHDPAPYLAETLGKATPLYRTWVAGGVYRIVRRDFRWGDAPALALPDRDKHRDVPQQMRVYALERSLSREERLAASAGGGSDLVGRDAEKADLQAAYHQAVSAAGGGGNVVHRAVVGELGIGKTALVSAFVADLPPNARLVRAECSPVRMEVPLSLIADLVRDAIGVTGEEPFEEVGELIARAGGGTAQGDASNPIVARLAELATNRQVGDADEDAQFRRRNIVTGLRNLFAAIALSQPLVILVESLQWGDKQSLEILGELMRAPDPLPILFVLVARPDDHVASVLEGVVRIELASLSPDEQVRLVEARLGAREGVRQVLGDLMPRVGGNPFFLLEMVDALLERGSLELREVPGDDGETKPVLAYAKNLGGGREGSIQLPSTLEQLLSDRLRELPTEEHLVVDWLAIAGGPLVTADLEKLAPKIHEDAVVRLCARGLCDKKGDQVDFRHPLTRDVAYTSMAPDDRVQMHRVLGEHLRSTSLARGLSAAIVARHLARGEAGEEASDLYAEAGFAARAGNQTQLALRYFKRASHHLSPNDPRQLGLHAELETIYRMLGRRRDRIASLGALRRVARRIGTPRATCFALLRSGRFFFDEGRLSTGLPIAKLAAEIAHGASITQLEVEAEALVSELLRELGDVQGALAACDRALATCNPVLNPHLPPRLRADVLRSQGVLLRRVGRVREAMEAHIQAIGVFRRTGARRQEARAKNSLAFALFVQGRFEDAIALAVESIQIDLSIGGRFQIANTLTNIGHAYAKVGDIPRAQAYLSRARETHERYGDQDNRADTLIVSAETMIEEGNIEEAEAFLRDAAALIEVTDNAYAGTHHGVIHAVLAREMREPTQAISYALEARRAAEDQTLVSFHFYGMAVEAAAHVDAGEMHAGTLLATTALGAVETIQGCEYGLEIRVLCADALKRAGSPQAALAHQRAVDHAQALLTSIRDARLRRLFVKRPIVAALFDTTPAPVSSPEAGAPSLEGDSN
jgi:serine/threonine protein kinase/tetratricopeptide (TPR) repeat protein